MNKEQEKFWIITGKLSIIVIAVSIICWGVFEVAFMDKYNFQMIIICTDSKALLIEGSAFAYGKNLFEEKRRTMETCLHRNFESFSSDDFYYNLHFIQQTAQDSISYNFSKTRVDINKVSYLK